VHDPLLSSFKALIVFLWQGGVDSFKFLELFIGFLGWSDFCFTLKDVTVFRATIFTNSS
jgi:hypothetical protein